MPKAAPATTTTRRRAMKPAVKPAVKAPVVVPVLDARLSVASLVDETSVQKTNDAILKAIIASLPPKKIRSVSLDWTRVVLERRIRALRKAELRHRTAELAYRAMLNGVVLCGSATSADIVIERHEALVSYLAARAAEGRARDFLWRKLDNQADFGL